MKSSDLILALSATIPPILAEDLVNEFLSIRQDLATRTFGRTAPGKFVETLVQILEHLETGAHSAHPDVDRFLRGLESRPSTLDEGLRICASRVARAMYALRSKRNIAHKGKIDPNAFDLQFLFAGAQWIMAELLRTASGSSMEEAGNMIARVQAPVGALVDDFAARRLTVAGLTAREELLLLLSHVYPDVETVDSLAASADRISRKTVTNTLRKLWTDRLVEGSAASGYQLTGAGLAEARIVAMGALSRQRSGT